MPWPTSNPSESLAFTTESEQVANKGAASGYAPLDSASKVPTTNLGGSGGSATKYLRGDQTWQTPPGGGEAFPVGSVFVSVVSTNPGDGSMLGYGTWVGIGAGRVLVGLDSGDADFDTVEETGGAKTHTLTSAEIPAHTHPITDSGHAHNQQRHATATGSLTGITTAPDTSSSNPQAMGPNTASATTGITVNNNTGGGGAHNNLPPFFVVYLWKRTA